MRELLEGVRDDAARAGEITDAALDDLDDGATAPPTRSSGRQSVPGQNRLRHSHDSRGREHGRLAPVAKVDTDEQQRLYRICSLALPKGGTYTLAVLRCLEQGNADAQAAAHALLEDLAPRFLLVVGIAGGVPSHEFSRADVVVSSRIVDFSVEAVIRDKAREYALSGGPAPPGRREARS